jgi:uncharacterized iron-regulated membrane protein
MQNIHKHKKFSFWLRVHSVSGFAGFLFIWIIFFTGVLNVFHGAIKQLEHPENFRAVRSENAALSAGQLYKIISNQYPEITVEIFKKIPGNSNKPIETIAYVDDVKSHVYFHPFTGELMSVISSPLHLKILNLHTSLLLGTVGTFWMGIIGILLLMIVMSGLIYYRKQLKRALFFQLSNKIADKRKRKHIYVGVWSSVFFLLAGVTGLYLQWQKVVEPQQKFKIESVQMAADMDELIQKINTDYPEVELNRIQLPIAQGMPLVIMGNDPGKWYLGVRPAAFYFDVISGEMLLAVTEKDYNAYNTFSTAMHTLHTAKFGGFFIKLLYAFIGVAGMVVSTLGMMIYFQKRN